MIKRCRNPCRRRVAGLALMREASLHMVWTGRSVVILDVAAVAIGRRPLEFAADMACSALERCVRTS